MSNWSPGGGGGAGGAAPLLDSTLAAPAASFDISGLSLAAYLYVELIAKLRVTGVGQGAGFDHMQLQFNGDGGNNYNFGQGNEDGTFGLGTVGGPTMPNMVLGHATTSGSTAGYYTWNRALLWLPGSADAVKSVRADSVLNIEGTAHQIANMAIGVWYSAAPINRVTVFSGSGQTWAAGSRLLLRGWS